MITVTRPAGAASSGSGLDSGSTFPVSPTVDDLFFYLDSADDLTGLYFYDGTYWLSSQEFPWEWSCNNNGPYTANASMAYGGVVRLTAATTGSHFESDVFITRWEYDSDLSVGTPPSLAQLLRITVAGTFQDHAMGAYYKSGRVDLPLTIVNTNGLYVTYIFSTTGQAAKKLTGRIFYRKIGA